jgi:[ribosomal protein S5]-alanine N-acetyltransferase
MITTGFRKNRTPCCMLLSVPKLFMNLVLETPRLILEPILTTDFQIFHHILTDPYVRKYLCDDKVFSDKQIEEMIAESEKLFASEKLGLWLIKTKNKTNSDREIIGFVGLWYFFAENQPQLAYALLPEATKKGYATEAATKIIEYCFEQLAYDYLVASSDKPNLESHQLAKKLGMKQVAEKNINGNPILFFKIEKSSL